MNRTTLLLVIAVIAAVGIAVSLFLAGPGQTGALTGRIAPLPTTLTLSYTVPMEDGSGGYRWTAAGDSSTRRTAPSRTGR